MSDTETTHAVETAEPVDVQETKIASPSDSDPNDSEQQPVEVSSESETAHEEVEPVQESAEVEQEPTEEPSEGDAEEKNDDEDYKEEDTEDVQDAEAPASDEAQGSEQESESAEVEETAESNEAEQGESTDPTDIVENAAEQYGRAENVQYDLLQRQAQYIMESNMLNLPEYQQLSQEDKITALVNMLNSNPETKMPMIPEPQSYPQSSVSSQPAQEVSSSGRPRPDLNGPMSPEERERYSLYLHGENKITEMHDIPPKSRLFIGNLPLKNVSKEDLFRIFSPYGHILQINIKNAFGFIQYNNPQSVRNAIESESQEQNFGKKLILEVSSSNARPQFDHGDHGTNSSSTFISSSKRPFQQEENDAADMYNDNQGYKKSKRRVPACVIYVKRTADRGYANEVFNHFRRGTDLETDMIFLKPRMELRKMINEVAHDGVWGVILVNKTRNVDIQTFYKGPQGETKFDEYISISADDAIAIFNNLKPSRGSTTEPPMGAVNPYAQQPAAMPPTQPPPSQNYYGGYGMPPPMHQQAPPQQPYVQQGYGMPLPNQGYGAPAPPPVAQPYGRYQSSPPAMDPTGLQPQLSSLLGASGGGQMNQQQLLAAIQNLPPNVVSNLLSMAQQQQQQQQPQAQQQLLGLLQSMQGQQPPPQQQASAYSSLNDGYAQPPAMGAVPQQSPPVPSTQPQQQQPQQSSPGNNVQSLLDSLAKLQK